MKLQNFILAATIATATIAGFQAHAAPVPIANDGFEVPNIGNGFLYNATGATWTFNGGSGLAANGSGFNVSGAPNGNTGGQTSTAGQAGFIQGGDGTVGAASFSQLLSGFEAGETTVSFLAESRVNGGTFLNVYLGGVQLLFGGVGDILPPSTSVFTAFTSDPITVAAGDNLLEFRGNNINLGDRSSFVDSVSVTNVPEPTTAAFSLLSAVGMLALRRRRA